MKTAQCHPDRKHYGHGMCSACYQRHNRWKSKRKGNEYSRQYHAAHKSKMNARSRSWWAKLSPEERRLYKFERKCKQYGISVEKYNAMYAAQRGLCAVCKEKPAETIDHYHRTGAVRELLCNQCNLTLGHIESRGIDWAHSLVSYLEKWRHIMSLPIIAISNESTVLTDEQVSAVIPALQQQVSKDYKAYWEQDATLIFLPKNSALVKGWWQIVILDNPDQAGCLGYHELSSQGTPLGKVFAKLDLDNNLSWTVTFSHELLEMLADPWIDYCVAAEDGKIYALEVADAVEDDSLGYELDGVLVSDFVTPSWFESTEADRLDFKQHLSKPLQLAKNGYISILDLKQGWKQIYGEAAQVIATAPFGSRRHRRTLPASLWRNSER